MKSDLRILRHNVEDNPDMGDFLTVELFGETTELTIEEAKSLIKELEGLVAEEPRRHRLRGEGVTG